MARDQWFRTTVSSATSERVYPLRFMRINATEERTRDNVAILIIMLMLCMSNKSLIQFILGTT